MGHQVDRTQEVTDKIVAALEAGVPPWRCPWDRGKVCFPYNGHTERPYNGINVLLLWASGYADPRWYTYKQAAEHGQSHVRKGGKGTHVIFWKFLVKELEEDGEKVKKTIPFLRVYTVFNHSQVSWEEGEEPGHVDMPVSDVTEFFHALPVSLSHVGGRAAYSPSTDTIALPSPSDFKDLESYWSARAHETIHWTGHPDRLNRNLDGRFGDSSYAMEELVAEMGAAFLCTRFGFQSSLQHAEYINHWVDVMKADKYAVFTAARKAQEAIAYLDDLVEAMVSPKAA